MVDAARQAPGRVDSLATVGSSSNYFKAMRVAYGTVPSSRVPRLHVGVGDVRLWCNGSATACAKFNFCDVTVQKKKTRRPRVRDRPETKLEVGISRVGRGMPCPMERIGRRLNKGSDDEN
jgi:hypothetical protein